MLVEQYCALDICPIRVATTTNNGPLIINNNVLIEIGHEKT